MYLFLDCETGGLTPDHSLLTLAAIVADKDFRPIRGGDNSDTLTLEIRHPTYVVTAGALRVNQINLVEHNTRGVPPDTARKQFADFVCKAVEDCGGGKLVPAGHNLAFDLKFVWAQLMAKEQWDQYCDCHFMDTMVAARFFKAAGVIQSGCSLTDLRDLFHVDTGVAHTALADTQATLAIARALTEIAHTTGQRPAGVYSR